MTAHATAGQDARACRPHSGPRGDGDTTGGVRTQVAGFLNLCFARSVLEDGLDRRLRAGARVTVAQHEVLYRLSLAPGGRLRMTELADVLLTSKSGATRLVARMEAAGLVAREQSASDRRHVFAVLTASGGRVLAEATPVFVEGIASDFGDLLDAEDHEDLRRILRKLLAAHGAWDERRCEPPPPTAARWDAGPEGATR